MKETGNVVRIEGNRAVVRMGMNSGCRSCSASRFCHPSGPGRRELLLDMNGISCRPDDSVEIETPARSFLTAAFLVFIFPLILSIAASFAVASIDRRYSAAGFFGTFLFAELLIFGIDRIFGRSHYFQPKITGRIGDADHGKIQDDRTPGNS